LPIFTAGSCDYICYIDDAEKRVRAEVRAEERAEAERMIQEKNREMARAMKNEKISYAIIVKVTGLTMEEVEKL
jgi:hypothetical protein